MKLVIFHQEKERSRNFADSIVCFLDYLNIAVVLNVDRMSWKEVGVAYSKVSS